MQKYSVSFSKTEVLQRQISYQHSTSKAQIETMDFIDLAVAVAPDSYKNLEGLCLSGLTL